MTYQESVVFALVGAAAGSFVLWGAWRVIAAVLRARGLELEDHERRQRELQRGARYPREPR